MTRVKEFNTDLVLDKAMEVFWEKGYKATSLCDLLNAMGIQRGSMYNSLGNKESVYLACLERFPAKTVYPTIEKIDNTSSGIKKIHMLFNFFLKLYEAGDGLHGCMLTNAATEVAPHNKRVAKYIQGVFKAREDLFCRWLKEAVKKGELGKEAKPKELARYLNTFMLGLSVLVRTKPDVKTLRNIVRQALSVLN